MASLPAVAVPQIAIAEVKGSRVVQGELGQALPQITDGFGGFATVDRTGRIQSTWWQGRNTIGVTFGIRFDQRATLRSVEPQIRRLEALAGVGLPDDVAPPAIVFDAAGMVPLDRTDPRAQGWTWAINAAPDVQEAERHDQAGYRFVYEANLTLIRQVSNATLKSKSEAAARRAKQRSRSHDGPKHRTHKVKTGETLVKIAAREYGDVDRWHDIARANHLRDPRAPLKPGTVLKLPN